MWDKQPDLRAYIGILLSLFAISFFSIFALRPTLVTIGEIVAQIRTQKEVNASLEQKIKSLQLAQANWRKITADLPLIDQALPELPAPQNFARQTEAVAAKQNVLLKDLSLGKVSLLGDTSSGLQLFPFSFTVQGEPARVFSFLSNFESSRLALVWQTVTIGKKAKTEGQETGTQLNLTVSGGVAYYK